MTIQITGRNIEITSSIQQAVNNAFSKINERHSPISQLLTFEKTAGQFNVHIEYKPDSGACLNASSTHSDLYAGIRQAVSKLERQLDHAKGVMQSKRTRNLISESGIDLPLHTESIHKSILEEDALNAELNPEFIKSDEAA